MNVVREILMAARELTGRQVMAKVDYVARGRTVTFTVVQAQPGTVRVGEVSSTAYDLRRRIEKAVASISSELELLPAKVSYDVDSVDHAQILATKGGVALSLRAEIYHDYDGDMWSVLSKVVGPAFKAAGIRV
jgi:hypothetical protein